MIRTLTHDDFESLYAAFVAAFSDYVVKLTLTHLPQLVVRRDARRRGIGTRLLESAAAVAGKPLRIMNVDESDAGIAAFLEHNGARRTVRQLEMTRPLR